MPSMLAAICWLLSAPVAVAALPVHGVVVKATYPHDTRAYTQGLFYRDGVLFESTGLEGQSTLRRVRLKDGAVLRRQRRTVAA